MKSKWFIGLVVSLVVIAGLLNIYPQSELDEQILKTKQLLHESFVYHSDGKLKEAYAIINRCYSVDSENPYVIYYKAMCEYRFLEFSLDPDKSDLFDEYIDLAEEHADLLLENEELASEANVLLSAITIMKIANNSTLGMTHSGLVYQYAEDAIELDDKNPRPYIFLASMLYNTPEMFGGDALESLNMSQTALHLFENHTYENPLHPDWGKLDVLAWLGQAYNRLGEIEKAKTIYEQALEMEPEFAWVKYALMPQLQQQLESSSN